jgi:hypothetical protein
VYISSTNIGNFQQKACNNLHSKTREFRMDKLINQAPCFCFSRKLHVNFTPRPHHLIETSRSQNTQQAINRRLFESVRDSERACPVCGEMKEEGDQRDETTAPHSCSLTSTFLWPPRTKDFSRDWTLLGAFVQNRCPLSDNTSFVWNYISKWPQKEKSRADTHYYFHDNSFLCLLFSSHAAGRIFIHFDQFHWRRWEKKFACGAKR